MHAPARPAQSKRPIGRRPAHVEPAVVVVDDLPALVPVTRREIEVIETYLSALVDEALAGGIGDQPKARPRKLLARACTGAKIDRIAGTNP